MWKTKKPFFYDNLVILEDESSTNKMELWRRLSWQSKTRGGNEGRSNIDNVFFTKEHQRKKGKGESVYIIPVPDMTSTASFQSCKDNSLKLDRANGKRVWFSDLEIIEESEKAEINVVTDVNRSKGSSTSPSPADPRDHYCSPPGYTVTEESNTDRNQKQEEEEDDRGSDSELVIYQSKKFQVLFSHKFGAKLDSTPGLVDAKAVSHVLNGSVLVTDLLRSKVCLYERSGSLKRSFKTHEVSEPWAATMTPDGEVAVTLRRQRCVALWSDDGQMTRVFGHNVLQRPTGISVDKQGRMFVADEERNDVFVFSSSGEQMFKLSDFQETSFKQPRFICCSQSGRILVSDSGNHCITVFDRNGSFLFSFGSFGRGNGQFKFPYGVCVDQHDNIVVADHHNDRVVMFTENGEFVQNLVTSETGLRSPCGVTIRCTNNRKLYITHGDLRPSEVLVYNLLPVDSEPNIGVKHFV